MTGREARTHDGFGSSHGVGGSSGNSGTGKTSNSNSGPRKRVRQLASQYNPCGSCRETEAHTRLTHDIHSLRVMELAPMQMCNESAPSCERCSDAGVACKYDTGSVNTYGINEQEDLRYRLECRSREYQEAVFLLRVFRHGSDQDAAALLARLRVGHDVGTILESLRGAPEQTVASPL